MCQAQIAAVCGFTDASHMNVVFRRRCGVRPSEFRMGVGTAASGKSAWTTTHSLSAAKHG